MWHIFGFLNQLFFTIFKKSTRLCQTVKVRTFCKTSIHKDILIRASQLRFLISWVNPCNDADFSETCLSKV